MEAIQSPFRGTVPIQKINSALPFCCTAALYYYNNFCILNIDNNSQECPTSRLNNPMHFFTDFAPIFFLLLRGWLA